MLKKDNLQNKTFVKKFLKAVPNNSQRESLVPPTPFYNEFTRILEITPGKPDPWKSTDLWKNHTTEEWQMVLTLY